jgi:hypothetical protein
MPRLCGCRGFEDIYHEHDGTSGTCFQHATEPSGLCRHCDDARYAAIGRAAERLFTLLAGTNDR